MYFGLHVKCPAFLFEFSGQILEKDSNIKFHENPFSGSRSVYCGRTDGQTGSYDEASNRFSHF